jgi:hypothetical protein
MNKIEYNEIFNNQSFSLIFNNEDINILYKNKLITNLDNIDINIKNIITKFINKDLSVINDCSNIPNLQWKLFEIKCKKINKINNIDNIIYKIINSYYIDDTTKDIINNFIEYNINFHKNDNSTPLSDNEIIQYMRKYIDIQQRLLIIDVKVKSCIYWYFYNFVFKIMYYIHKYNHLKNVIIQKMAEVKKYLIDTYSSSKFELYDDLLLVINKLENVLVDLEQ